MTDDKMDQTDLDWSVYQRMVEQETRNLRALRGTMDRIANSIPAGMPLTHWMDPDSPQEPSALNTTDRLIFLGIERMLALVALRLQDATERIEHAWDLTEKDALVRRTRNWQEMVNRGLHSRALAIQELFNRVDALEKGTPLEREPQRSWLDRLLGRRKS